MRARPLLGEPLALDLVDTAWKEQGAWVDFFEDTDAVHTWLSEHDLPRGAHVEAIRDHLLRTRNAIRAHLAGAHNQDQLNAVLEHGARRPQLRNGLPYEDVVVDDPAWHAAWVAAADYVRLVRERPERVRECANPECVLWFLDVSKNGSRRWCSMEVCGNRAKVGRFNQRHRAS